MIHSSGGDYTYIKMAFGDWAGKQNNSILLNYPLS
jgi:hypothetical protein